jgi:crotonobetainyl-CoA:carnitine CoA-transferase CaiB-like acyl-CoA transferase
VRNKAALLPMIAEALREKPRDHWLAALEAAGVPSGPVNDIGELAASEQFAASKIMQTLPEAGPRVVGLPISFNRRRPVSRRPAPRIGQHNQEILGRP